MLRRPLARTRVDGLRRSFSAAITLFVVIPILVACDEVAVTSRSAIMTDDNLSPPLYDGSYSRSVVAMPIAPPVGYSAVPDVSSGESPAPDQESALPKLLGEAGEQWALRKGQEIIQSANEHKRLEGAIKEPAASAAAREEVLGTTRGAAALGKEAAGKEAGIGIRLLRVVEALVGRLWGFVALALLLPGFLKFFWPSYFRDGLLEIIGAVVLIALGFFARFWKSSEPA